MRRPAPLPAERAAGAVRAEDAPVQVDAPQSPGGTDSATALSHTESARDLIPAPRRHGAPTSAGPAVLALAPAEPEATTESGVSEGETPGDEGVGVRDVWAAARARRRALRAEVRRFTVRQRRRRTVWIIAVASVVVLLLGTLGIAYSPLFAVQKISVVGTQTLEAGAVEAALAGQLGTPLPRVDSSAVKAALVAFPLVESYTLEARPPNELVVRIVERTPIGSVQSDAGYTLVDAAGVALSTTPEPAPGHPVITAEGGIGSPAFVAIGTVFRTLPAGIRNQVTAMSAKTANDVTLTLGATGTQVVWGNADESAKKAVVLASAMTARPPDGVVSYDVSSPGAVVIR